MICERLKGVRLSLGYDTRKEFAALLGLRPTTYNGYENGSREIPDSVKVLLSEQFHVHLDWLITGKGDMFWHTQSQDLPTVEELILDLRDNQRLQLMVAMLRKDCLISDIVYRILKAHSLGQRVSKTDLELFCNYIEFHFPLEN